MLWLGASRGENGEFLWLNDAALDYTDWLEGEPNNEGGNESCLVMLNVKGNWAWADVPNDVSGYYGEDKVGFVCEWDS